jgi:hypothetical protein
MTKMGVMKRAVLALAVLVTIGGPALAETLPIPSQAEWADAKKTVKLENGVTLA